MRRRSAAMNSGDLRTALRSKGSAACAAWWVAEPQQPALEAPSTPGRRWPRTTPQSARAPPSRSGSGWRRWAAARCLRPARRGARRAGQVSSCAAVAGPGRNSCERPRDLPSGSRRRRGPPTSSTSWSFQPEPRTIHPRGHLEQAGVPSLAAHLEHVQVVPAAGPGVPPQPHRLVQVAQHRSEAGVHVKRSAPRVRHLRSGQGAWRGGPLPAVGRGGSASGGRTDRRRRRRRRQGAAGSRGMGAAGAWALAPAAAVCRQPACTARLWAPQPGVSNALQVRGEDAAIRSAAAQSTHTCTARPRWCAQRRRPAQPPAHRPCCIQLTHSHRLYTMGRPLALSASRMATKRPSRSSWVKQLRQDRWRSA